MFIGMVEEGSTGSSRGGGYKAMILADRDIVFGA